MSGSVPFDSNRASESRPQPMTEGAPPSSSWGRFRSRSTPVALSSRLGRDPRAEIGKLRHASPCGHMTSTAPSTRSIGARPKTHSRQRDLLGTPLEAQEVVDTDAHATRVQHVAHTAALPDPWSRLHAPWRPSWGSPVRPPSAGTSIAASAAANAISEVRRGSRTPSRSAAHQSSHPRSTPTESGPCRGSCSA